MAFQTSRTLTLTPTAWHPETGCVCRCRTGTADPYPASKESAKGVKGTQGEGERTLTHTHTHTYTHNTHNTHKLTHQYQTTLAPKQPIPSTHTLTSFTPFAISHVLSASEAPAGSDIAACWLCGVCVCACVCSDSSTEEKRKS